MKKTYINPSIEVFKIAMTQQMLAGSEQMTISSETTSTLDARDSDLDDDF